VSEIAIDTSAVVEILRRSPQAPVLHAKMAAADLVIASPITRVEAALVMMGRFGWSRVEFDRAWDSLSLEEVLVDAAFGVRAIDAFESWGRGRGTAGLNFGDCFSYALAAGRRLPLLFVGRDFAKTDIEQA
jgi:ribonuclease VapC